MLKDVWVQRSIIGGLLVVLLGLAACGGSSGPAAGNQAPAPSAPGSSNAGQIVISGAVSKTFTPVKVEAALIGSNTVIYLTEGKGPSGVSLSFPPDTQPGVYPIGKEIGQPDVLAHYEMYGANTGLYYSNKGTLTLTAVGPKFSGQFQFTAVDSKDSTKTIEVSGSFTDVPFIP